MKKQLSAYLPALTAGIFVVQPMMDVLSFWTDRWEMSGSLTLILRLVILVLTIFCGFVLSERKWVYLIAVGICAVFFAAHAVVCFVVGYQDIVRDFTNYIRIIQMPMMVLCLITFFRTNEKSFEGMQMGLTLSLLLMLFVMALSVLTDTDPNTYSYGYGVLGWFNNTNSQSCNLCVLLAISLAWQLVREKRKPLLFWLTAAGGLAALYFLAPRLAYLGILVITAGLSITLFLVRRSQWKTATALALVCVLFVVLIPVSPMGQRASSGGKYENAQQSQMSEILGENSEQILSLAQRQRTSGDLTEEEYRLLVEGLTPVYEKYIRDFVEYFGAEETMKMYDYTVDYTDFTALRAKKIMFARVLMQNSPAAARLFGLELGRFTVSGRIYDVENDFHGIYYLCGGVGLALYLAFLLYFLALVVWALVKNAKQYFTVEAAGYGVALLLCLAHACTTSGVLRRPNASIYLSAILAAIYYLVRIRTYKER